MRFSIFLFLFVIAALPLFAQTHHALTGSRYAGSLGMYQNPASTLSSADTTDFSLANAHFNTYTNYINFGYAPLLSKNPALTLNPSIGDYPRELITNFHLNILSFKHKLNEKTAIGFGINLRSLINVNTSHYNLTDSTNDIINFFEQNSKSLPFNASLATSNWLEYVANISRNIIDNRKYLLNIGGNIRMNRGLAGVVGSLGNFQYRKYNYSGVDAYEITNADFMYGISTTLAAWDNTQTFKENYRNLRGQMKTGASLDVGTEILIKEEQSSDWFYEGLDYNYGWKIGLSLVDLGFAKYEYFSESAISSGMKQNITPEILIDKFFGAVNSLADFNDSIATVVEKFEHLKGNFNIYHPTRINVNIDRKINSFIYINAALSLPFSLVSNSHYITRDIAYLNVTPRIENRNVGFYLPISYNPKTTWNVGAALRAGPIMLGLNDLHVFNNKTDLQNIGAYVSFLFHFRKHVPKEHFDFLRCTKKTL
jgi:hypothetical protein